MSRNDHQRSPMALVPPAKKEVASQSVNSLHRLRSAVDISEDADARLTGMTRSLDRRLLALNLQPFSQSTELGFMKVA